MELISFAFFSLEDSIIHIQSDMAKSTR